MYVRKVSKYGKALYASLPATYRFSEAYVIPRSLFEELKSLGKYCSELTLRINSPIVNMLISLQYNRIIGLVKLFFKKKHVSGYSTKRISLSSDDVDENGEVVILSSDEFEEHVRHIAQGIVCYIFCTAEEVTKILVKTLERLRSNHCLNIRHKIMTTCQAEQRSRDTLSPS